MNGKFSHLNCDGEKPKAESFFSSKWRAERSYVTGLRRWRKYSAYRKYAQAMSGSSGEERQLFNNSWLLSTLPGNSAAAGSKQKLSQRFRSHA
jgi:hypothetical protein